MDKKLRGYLEVRALLSQKYLAYPIDTRIFVGGAIDNDEQLPFAPNAALSITNPVILAEKLAIDAHSHLDSIRTSWDEYKIDYLESITNTPLNEIPLFLLNQEHQLGIRCSIVFCVLDDEILGYRVFGWVPDFDEEMFTERTS